MGAIIFSKLPTLTILFTGDHRLTPEPTMVKFGMENMMHRWQLVILHIAENLFASYKLRAA